MNSRYALGLVAAGILSGCSTEDDSTTFQEAQNDPTVRSQYIDELVEKERSKGRIDFTYVEDVIYDPGFSQFREDAKKIRDNHTMMSADWMAYDDFATNMKSRKPNSYHPGATLPTSLRSGTENSSRIYVSEQIFNPSLIHREDDVLTMIDHEVWHTITIAQGMPMKKGALTKEEAYQVSANLKQVSVHAYVYDKQHRHIQSGEFHVSPPVKQMIRNSYGSLYTQMMQYSTDQGPNGKWVQAILEKFKYRPFQKGK